VIWARIVEAVHPATLTETGWSVPTLPVMERYLDSVAAPTCFGPADGDPIYCAAHKAAEILGGKAVIRPFNYESDDVVY